MLEKFEVKIKYQKEDPETGLRKTVTEPYVFDAYSFTDCEQRVLEELGDSIRGDWRITHMRIVNIIDVFKYTDADIFYNCQITYTVADGDSGKEKKVKQWMLVTATNVTEAETRIRESLSTMLVTFRVPEVKETKIVEFYGNNEAA